jgi:hypothetical protein
MPGYEYRHVPGHRIDRRLSGYADDLDRSVGVARVLDGEIKAGRSLTFIAVMPTHDVAGGRDTQCVNVAGGPTWRGI